MLRASANHIRFQSIHSNPIDYPSTINTNSPNANHPYFKHNTRHHPISFALKIDRVNILLDAGCPLTFADSNQWLSAYARVIANVDGVLLSGPEIVTCGAVPFLKKLRPNIDITAMSSTSRVGLFTVLSTFQNLFGNEKTFTYTDPNTRQQTTMTVTSEDVYRAFQSIKEPFGFKATFTPSSSSGRRGAASEDGSEEQIVEARPTHNGQCMGGYIWVLSYQTDEVTYAPNFSTKPSNYLKTLSRASMEAPSRCNILLTDATAASISTLPTVPVSSSGAAENGSKKSRATDYEFLLSAVQEGLHNDHDIVIPVDATIKGVEILGHLVKYAEERFLRDPIVFLFPHAEELLETVRVKTDSLNEAALGSDAELFVNVKCARSIEEAAEYKSPRIIVCDGADLDYGLGIEMLNELKRLSRPWTLCFTQFPAPWTNAGRLYAKFHPDLASSKDDTLASNPNMSSGVVTKYVCDSVRLDSGSSNVFNKGRYGGSNLPTALSHENSISLSYIRRREYDAEEQAAYTAKREEEAAAEERRRLLESGGANESIALVGDRIVVDTIEDSDDEDEDAANAAPLPKIKVQHTPGLFLPSHLASFNTRHLVFPKVSSGVNEHTVYGMALQDWERHIFSTRGHAHTHTDHGPMHQGTLRNELLEYAKMPAHITREDGAVFNLSGCRCATVDMSNLLDVRGFLRFLKGFASAKKVVFLRGSTVDTQKHIVTPLQVEQKSRAALVSSNALASNRRLDLSGRKGNAIASISYYLQTSHFAKGLELATVVAAYDVRLAPALASLAQRSLCKVQERTTLSHGSGVEGEDAQKASRGSWEIGWLHGYVAPPRATAQPRVRSQVGLPQDGVDGGDRVGGEKRKRIEFVEGDGLVSGVERSAVSPTSGAASSKPSAEEQEQADVAALFSAEEGISTSSHSESTPAETSKHSNGADNDASSAAVMTAHREKAAAIKTLHPIPAHLEAAALVHMEHEGIVQGSVFVGGVSLPAMKDQARDIRGSISTSIANRATASSHSIAMDRGASAMGGDAGSDMVRYPSLVKAINLNTVDGSDVLPTELLQAPNEALVLGYDTIVRQQGGALATGGRAAEDAAAVLGDVAVEGVVSPNFFAVRELVYSQFARIL